MSKNLPIAKITLFDEMVHQEYQSTGFKLMNTTRKRTNVVGATVRYTILGEGIARQKAPQDDVSPMNPSYSVVEMTLQDWNAPEYTDIFDQATVNFDEQSELAKLIGKAIGRRMDQLIIDSMHDSTTPNVIVHGSTGFTYDKWRAMNKFFSANGIGPERRHLAITADSEADLLDETKLTSSDFVQQQFINRGGLDGVTIGGYTIHVIPSMREGGLPDVANIQTCFAWAEDSTGYGIGIDFRTEVNYIPEKTSWLVNGVFKANAVAIDNKGIVKIDTVKPV